MIRHRPNPRDYPSPLDYEDALERYEEAELGRREARAEEREIDREEHP